MTKELSEAARQMGRKGGKARAKNLTKEQISAIARKAGLASGKARKEKQASENLPNN